MKFGFVTCVELGLSCMEQIYKVGGKLDLAITLLDTQANGKSGRIYLDEFCGKNSIPLVKSSHVNNQDVIKAIENFDIDWLFIIGWSQIASKELLDSPNKGVLGMHPTLLPVGRGRAAIPWAILKGLDKTGVTMFKLDEGVDTGPIVDQIEIPLNKNSTATSLYYEVNQAHAHLIGHAFPLLAEDKLTLRIQDESKATEWIGRKPSDGQINLKGSLIEAETLIRAITRPYPGAFAVINGVKHIIWEARLCNEKTDGLVIEFFDGYLECLDYEIDG